LSPVGVRTGDALRTSAGLDGTYNPSPMSDPELFHRPTRFLGRAHLLVGAAGVVGFLCSGLYMHFGLAHLHGLDRATRLSYRSIHIYLLFSSLLNFVLAPRLKGRRTRSSAVSLVGSVLLLAGPPFLAAAFILEPLLIPLDREFTRIGIVVSAAGALLKTLSELRKPDKE
jgi:hypothetical protein